MFIVKKERDMDKKKSALNALLFLHTKCDVNTVTGDSSLGIANPVYPNNCILGPGLLIKVSRQKFKYPIATCSRTIGTMRQYWAASFLLPIGSIVILAIVVLLMILFKRYPHMVVAVVAGILAIIMIFATFVSLSHTPVYD